MTNKEQTFKITGMSCAACANAVEKAVKKLEGVSGASVNFLSEKLVVMPAGEKLETSFIEEAVKKAGYGIAVPDTSKITIAVDGMTCASCASRIEKELSRTDGVDEASVNFATGKATVLYRADMVRPSELREAIKRAGYTPISSMEEKGEEEIPTIKRPAFNLGLSVLFIIPLAFVTMGHMLGLPLPEFISPDTAPLRYALLQLLLTAPILFAGRRFYVSGTRSVIHGGANMDTLIALGTAAAVIYSVWGTFNIVLGQAEYVNQLYFESAGFIITLILIGRFMEDKAKGRTSSAIRSLINLAPPTATLVDGESLRTIPADDIHTGDTLLVKAGERISADGLLLKGDTTIDESMITGESMPVAKKEGSSVTGGTINGSGVFRMRAERVGRDTTLSQIIKLVEDAQGSKAPIAALADRVAAVFVPIVLVIASLSAVGWLFAGKPFPFALSIFITVLIIACPCALGLATPTAIMVGTGRGAQLGVLIKNAVALEMASNIDTILFDKTGTITKGKPQVTGLRGMNGFNENDLWLYAASVEVASEHPVSKAVVEGAREKGIPFKTADEVKTHPGLGITGVVNGKKVVIGKTELLEKEGIDLKGEAFVPDSGKIALLIGIDGIMGGYFIVADEIKPTSQAAVSTLKAMGLKTAMVTGDREEVAKEIAQKAGIEEVFAEVMPQDKDKQVQKLQASGRKVGMVGDGINDAPALARADVGIAIGTGTDVAIESADIVLMSGDLEGVEKALRLSRATIRNIKQNLFWAFFYNSLGIPVAAGLLVIFGGPPLNPMFAAAAMSFSSISVLLNALRLKNFK